MAAVPQPLAPYVTSSVAYDSDLGAPGVHRGLPTTSLTLVLPVGEPLDVGWAEGAARARRWSAVSGLRAGPAAIHHDGRQQGVQVGLTTEGARALLGVPASALAGELLELEEVAPDLADLPEQLDDAAAAARPAVTVQALTAALSRNGEASARAEVGWALAALTRGERVAEVAGEVGYSRRRLSTLVREETGLAPKEYQRVARFQSSRAVLGRRPLAEVAAVCGYADQGHLAREWSELAGCPPSTWLREEFPFLQDLRPAGAAGSES